MSIIELENVGFRYRRGTGVTGVSLHADPGEWVCLFGGTGAGKSTILALLAGKLAPQEGRISLPRGMMKRTGWASDSDHTSQLYTHQQALSRKLARAGVATSQRSAYLAEALEWADLYDVRDVPLRELSAGARAVLTIATALVAHPAMLLLDNLVPGLPAGIASRLRAYLESRRVKEGLIVIQASSDSSEASRADRILMLDGGQALAFAPPYELLTSCAPDVLVVEAADPEAVRRTLRGIFDVEISDTPYGLRFTAADGTAAAAQLLRHPTGGTRAVYLQRATLWDALEALKRERDRAERQRVGAMRQE